MQWKKISLFIALPGIGLCAYNAVVDELEHMKHPHPEFITYEHLRIRKTVSFIFSYLTADVLTTLKLSHR